MGTVVHLRGSSQCGAAALRNLTLVFLGPRSFVGDAGGGAEVQGAITPDGAGFKAVYPIPDSYILGAPDGPVASTSVPVRPGSSYSFATYPGAACTVPFTVTQS